MAELFEQLKLIEAQLDGAEGTGLRSGSSASIQEPSRTECKFDFTRINPKYRAAATPDEELVLYKGAPRVRRGAGLWSAALLKGRYAHIAEVKSIIEAGDDALIRALFEAHTDHYSCTALLSATLNPEMAQVFAPTSDFFEPWHDTTIYQLRLRADRCVVDCYDTGGCGMNRELFILGAIFRDEITAVKLINDTAHSELLDPGGTHLHRLPEKNSKNRAVKDAKNWQ